MNSLKDFNLYLDVKAVNTFTRKSGNIGQEILVDSGSQYNAKVSAPDKEIVDLTNCKGLTNFKVSLGFKSFQLVSDNDKKYYNRIPTIFITGLVSSEKKEEVNNIEI